LQGDKTFLLAAVLAMKHPRLIVFCGAYSALVVMTILSAYLGHVVPNLISTTVTQFLAGLLFLFFGMQMTREALLMSIDKGVEELEEVTQELLEKESRNTNDMETGLIDTVKQKTPFEKSVESAENIMGYFFTPIFVQSFVMTFLGEWGDRSQIASTTTTTH